MVVEGMESSGVRGFTVLQIWTLLEGIKQLGFFFLPVKQRRVLMPL